MNEKHYLLFLILNMLEKGRDWTHAYTH